MPISDKLQKLYAQLMEGDNLLAIEKAKKNYADYVEYVQKGQYEHSKHTKLICEYLEKVERGKIKRLMLFVPPGHSKSETVTKTFPGYFIGKKPTREVIEISYNADLAEEFGYLNKQKVTEFGKTIFDIEVSNDKEAKATWGIKGTKGGMVSRGFGGDVTGRRASLLLIDDPVKNQEEADSENIREQRYKEYKSTLLTRLYPDGAIILIQTRWHELDLAGRILQEEGKESWTIVNLPFEAEENDLLGRAIGEPLWPEYGYTKEWGIERKRVIGSRAWNALYQQRPTSEHGGLINRNWFQYYTVLPQIITKVISVDATFKDKETSDFVAIQVWGKSGPNMYLIDCINARMDFPATLQAIMNVRTKHLDTCQILVEDKANGSAIIQVLRRAISGIVAVEPKGGKVSRVNAISAHIESKNVYLPKNASYTGDFEEQCYSFPNGKHDDMVDAMSQALARLVYMPAELPEGRRINDFFDRDEDDNSFFSCEVDKGFSDYEG